VKAYLLKKSGKPGVLKISEVPEPLAMQREVMVRLHYAGINYSEILSRKGLYGWAPRRPYIPGMEGVGEIVAVGESVPNKRVGEKVIVGAQHGCYAEYISVPEDQVLPVVTELTLKENAAILVNYLTAWIALIKLGRLQKGEKVLITVAAGGVGTAAVQIARHIDAQVYAMVGSDEKRAFIESLGARKGYNYQDLGIFDEVRKDTGGADVVLEMYGGKVYHNSRKLLNPFGRIVVMGYASLALNYWNPLSVWRAWRGIPRVSISELSEQSTGVMSGHLGYLLYKPELLRNIYEEMMVFIKENRIKPVIDRVYTFEELPAAHRYIEARRQKGKVVIDIIQAGKQ